MSEFPLAPGAGFSAWVDESMPRPGEEGEPAYLLAAAVADPARCEAMRQSLRRLRLGGEPKLHWRSERPARRRKIVQVLAGMEVESHVVIGTPLDPRKQERARSKCLERLLVELAGMSVSTVLLEQRTASLNRKDMVSIDRMRGRRLIPSWMRVEVARPSIEPMLWVPDAVCGACGDARRGDDQWLGMIAPKVTLVPIDVT